MGIGESIKEFYYSGEDKWYAFWDSVDEKIPVSGIIHGIDKFMPSFILFLIIVLILIIFIGWMLLGGLFASSVFMVRVTDSVGNPLPNSYVDVYLGDTSIISEATNEFGETKDISLAMGSVLTVTVTKDGFEEYSTEATLDKARQELEIVLEFIEESPREITILIKDQYNQPVLEPVVITFSCKNSSVTAPTEMTVATGRAAVMEPKNCGGLLASFDSSKYERQDSRQLNPGQQTVFLTAIGDTPIPENRGKMRVQLKLNDSLIDETVTVYLYKDNGAAGIGPIDTKDSINGIVEFEKSPGSYFVKTSTTEKYVQAVSEIVAIEAGKTTTVNLALVENTLPNIVPDAKIKIRLKDETSKQEIAEASVLLKKDALEIEQKTSDENGLVEFVVSEDTEYTVFIDAGEYCLKVLSGIRVSTTVQTIELKKFTSECGADLKVRVITQDGKPVKNATVGLYNEDEFSTGFANRITDLNGMVEFTRTPSGAYKAFALKGSYSGWSDLTYFQPRTAEQALLTVTMFVPNGTLRINVMDRDGNPLPGANVLFTDAITLERIGSGTMPVQDLNGTLDLVTKADKKIYFIITKDGYANYTSVVYPILPNTIQEANAIMEPETISGEVTIDFLGLYKGEEIAAVLAPGEEYTARLQITVPVNKSYKRLGIHLRTGTSSVIELDPVLLKEINVFGRPSIIKGTSYRPNNNYAQDIENITAGEAKWINAEWTEFQPGTIRIEAKLKVKETAMPNDEITFWYRTFAVDRRGRYLRDKEDRQLGTSENTDQKQALYAEAYQVVYNLGTETLCDGTFCFSANILDIDEGISEQATSGYTAKLFKDYLLDFAILNVSKKESDSYFDSELRIMNEDESLLFRAYSINGAQNETRSGNANSHEIDWTETGDFLPNTSIKGNLDFSTEQTQESIIKFQIRAAHRIIFERLINISIEANKELTATVAPEFLPNGVENKIIVTVLDKETGEQIEDALVKIKDRFNDVLSTARTNSKGIALLTLPAQQPGEILKMIVEKPEYMPFEKEITVDDKIAELNPDKLGITLNAKTKHEAEEEFSIENRSGIQLTVTDLVLAGRLEGLIDGQKAANWLDTFIGEKIDENGTKEFSLKLALTELGKQIEQTKMLDATIIATVSAMGGEWSYELPVTISIGLGGEVDNPNCFRITKHEWRANTEGQPLELEFEIQNNCSVNGNPVAIKDIEAMINWQSNETGTFSIATTTTQSELVSGYFKRILSRLEPEERATAVLTFDPDAALNAAAGADIFFRANNPTATGSQELKDKLNVQITVTNLIDCIAFDNDLITVGPEASGVFTIETLGCGGKTEFTLESELDLSNKKITLNPEDSAQIQVFTQGEIPGQYIVSVYAKTVGETGRRFIKNIRIRHQSDGCFEVSKFEFDIYRNPENPYSGYDTLSLTNHCYDYIENIEVVWSEKDLDKAMETGMLFAAIMGMANMMSQTNNQAPAPQQTFDQARTGQTSDWCLTDSGQMYYQSNGRYYDESQNEVGAMPPGACHPWASVTAKGGGTLNGFIKGNQLLDRNAGVIATRDSSGQWVRSGAPTTPETTPAAAPSTETPERENSHEAREDTAGKDVLPAISLQEEGDDGTGADAGDGGNGDSGNGDSAGDGSDAGNGTGENGEGDEGEGYTPVGPINPIRGPLGGIGEHSTYAGPPPLREPTMAEREPGESDIDEDREEDEEQLNMLMMMGPMMMGFGGMGGGEPNFMASAMQGFIMGTQMEYSQQEEGEFFYTEILRDLKHRASKLLLPSAKVEDDTYSEEYSQDIILEDLKEDSLEPREDYPNLNIEIKKLAVINEAGIEQMEPEKPFFRILQIQGERIEYETHYEYDEEKKPQEIRVKKKTKYVENFRLQFNSLAPQTIPIVPPWQVPNCQLGSIQGVTGDRGVPKVLFAWDWKSIKEDTCDESNPDAVYCDATQFSISVLKRLEKIKSFIEEHKPFNCPTGESAAAVIEQNLSTTAVDVGLTKIQLQKLGTDVNVVLTIASNNQREMSGSAVIEVLDSNDTAVASKTIAFDVLSETVVSDTFEGIPEGDYKVAAEISLDLCAGCENNNPANDTIKATLTMTARGAAKCTPYTTARLKDFLEATEFNGNATWTSREKQEILDLVTFNALLIKDAYPDDFRNDFHEFCMHKAFFDCPEFYSKLMGLGEIFGSQDNFEFDYSMPVNAPLQAGKYTVRIGIEFDNETWSFFENDQLSAKATVKMDHLEVPRIDNPFYHIPFDGIIGIDSANGRQGYGVNYRPSGEAPIRINNSSSQLVVTTPIASSTPAYGAWVSGGKVTNFKTLNNDRRGIIMDVVYGEESTNITLSPSYATPLMMKVSRDSGENAYGFYAVEIDSAPQSTLSRMIQWDGIGANCRDFHDLGITDAWQGNWDVHGGITGNVTCAVGAEITDYGVEWCSPSKNGDVFLESIVFTPQNSNSILKRKTFADDMQLIGINNQGAQIALNGVPGQEYNSFGVSAINSVQDVIDLVKQERVCVLGTSNRSNSTFFWNPKPVMDSLDDKRQAFAKQCIPAE